jgi:O-antigen/teichoic acid export membrane protein
MSATATKHAINRTAIYGASTILRSATSLVLLPIYTRYLTPTDYGTIELITLIVDIVAILIGARVTVGVFRFFNMADTEQERRDIVGSALSLVIVVNTLGVLLIICLDNTVASLLLGDSSYSRLIFLFSFNILFSALTSLCMSFLRAQDRAIEFFIYSVFKLISQVCLNLYFVVHLKLGVIGVIYAALLSGGLITGLLLITTLLRFGFSIKLSVIKKFVRFSIPLILSSIGMFFITYGDRYFLRVHHGLEDVGIYSLGYKFGFIFFSLCWAPFAMFWSVKQFELGKKEPNNPVFARVFKFVSIFLIGAALTIALYSQEIIIIMTDESFWPAANIAPIVTLAYLLLAWTDFTRFGLLFKDQTRYLAIGTLIGVIIIGAGYSFLIPVYGGIGAAWATVIGLGVRLIYINRKSQSYYDMGLAWSPILGLLASAIVLYLAATTLDTNLIDTLLIKACMIIGAAILIFFSPIITKQERKAASHQVAVIYRRITPCNAS